MFSRRRAKSNPPLRAAPSSAASTAAAQAFLNNRASNGSLSAAAAAAALRSHTTSPTPVGQVQTKRMLQRQASTSSNGSAAGKRPGGLQRTNSGGSMTERTFRDPSPSRRPASRPHDDEAPPLPPIPRSLVVTPPPVPVRSIRRPTSAEPPERIGSPPLKLPGGRGVSLDSGPDIMSGRYNRQPGAAQPSVGSFQEVEQSNGRGSVNFSRPMSPTNSPTVPSREGTSSSNPGNKAQLSMAGRAALKAAGVRNMQSIAPGAAGSPVKKKKKSVTSAAAENREVTNGGFGTKTLHDSLHATPQKPGAVSPSSTPSPASTASPASQPVSANVTGMKKKKRPTTGSTKSLPGEQLERLSQQSSASDSDTGSERSYSSDRTRGFNARATGLLTKQPSIVREDPEAEEQEERGGTTLGGSQGNVQDGRWSKPTTRAIGSLVESAAQSTAEPSNRPLSLQPTATSVSKANGTAKRVSLSPARAAHFSSQPLLETPEGIKHQPLGRSLSPAKSALKHSPSSRGSSPAGHLISGGKGVAHAPSEASDTTSVVSDDGYRSVTRAKKQVRVSFEDDPTVVGRAATPPSSLESPIVAIPKSKESVRKGWFGLGREKKRDQTVIGNENDDIIKPTPTLPSFGSVRGRRDDEELSPVSASKSPSTATSRSQTEHTFGDLAPSSDLAVGGILAQDYSTRSRQSHNDPLPPEVTSVEGSGYHSDSEDSGHDNERSSEQELRQVVPSGEEIPTISVQPATPGIGTSTREWLGMSQNSTQTLEPLGDGIPYPKPAVDDDFIDLTPSSVGIAEPEPEAAAAYHDPASPVIGEVAESLRHQTAHQHDDAASDGTGDSIYSDAAEDMSDLEGDGFGSINAIVESPTAPTFQNLIPRSPIAKPLKVPSTREEEEPPEPKSGEDWDKTQAYWSGLSHTRKFEIERAASIDGGPQLASEPIKKPKKKKKVVSNVAVQPTRPASHSLRTQDLEQSPKSVAPPMNKSMLDARPILADAIHLRSSLRPASPQPVPSKQANLRNSGFPSASPEPKGTLQKKLRPVSAVAMVDYDKPTGGANHARSTSDTAPRQSLTPVSAQPAKRVTSQPVKQSAIIQPTPRRILSTGSDSSSSFKKARATTSAGGRYNMKRSMRASSVDEKPRPTSGQPSRFSVRSLSPSGLIGSKPFNPPPTGLRASMRGSADLSNARTAKSPTRSFGFGKSSKPKTAAAKSGSRFSSRFGDSSDDDDGPATYQSRFVDSSDEDEPVRNTSKLTPVRGIPRRIDEGDSTDLEDSADERPSGRTRKSLPVTNLEGGALASGSLRPDDNADISKATEMGIGLQMKKAGEKDKKKRLFFGSLGRKKDDSKIKKADVESAARRDTPLERTKPERINSLQAAPQSPKSPKLVRRNTPKRYASDSWPLAQSIITVEATRPATSDGVAGAGRPALGPRQTTAQTTATDGVAVGRTGKKKRFPLLRKAFGLHD